MSGHRSAVVRLPAAWQGLTRRRGFETRWPSGSRTVGWLRRQSAHCTVVVSFWPCQCCGSSQSAEQGLDLEVPARSPRSGHRSRSDKLPVTGQGSEPGAGSRPDGPVLLILRVSCGDLGSPLNPSHYRGGGVRQEDVLVRSPARRGVG